MENRFGLFSVLFLLILISGRAQTHSDNTNVASSSIAIVYLSRTNNTKALAEMIQEKVGGELIALMLEKPYPKDYDAIVRQVAEENASGYLPPLKTRVKIDQYDTIFLGFPTWGMQLPPPIKSFLTSYNFKTKTIIPFNTNAGYGVGSGFRQVKELCEGCNVLKGLSVEGGIERDGILLAIKGERRLEVEKELDNWLVNLKLLILN